MLFGAGTLSYVWAVPHIVGPSPVGVPTGQLTIQIESRGWESAWTVIAATGGMLLLVQVRVADSLGKYSKFLMTLVLVVASGTEQRHTSF